MPNELKQNVFVDGRWYGPDYGNATPPAKVAEKITNEAAYRAPGDDTPDLRFRSDDFGGDDVPNLDALGRQAAALGGTVTPAGAVVPGDEEPPDLNKLKERDLRLLAAARGIAVEEGDNKKALIERIEAGSTPRIAGIPPAPQA